jgi:hypothetical protein
MYETLSVLRRPRNSRQALWRYYPENRLLDLLSTSELFFTHLPAFNDRLEGLLTSRSRERLLRWYMAHGSTPQNAEKEVREYETLRSYYHASCWHMSDHESYLMWKAYADRGYAIRTTFERIQASFDNFAGVITGGEVDYLDFSRDDTELGNAFTLVTTKDLPYRDEREFRLFFWQAEPRNSAYPLQPNGARVSVDLQFLVRQLYVSPLLGTPSAAVRQAASVRGIEVISSSILAKQYASQPTDPHAPTAA